MQNSLENVNGKPPEPAAHVNDAKRPDSGDSGAQCATARQRVSAPLANHSRKRTNGRPLSRAKAAATAAGGAASSQPAGAGDSVTSRAAHNELGKAGSDDASEFSAAHAASASSPACADRQAYAAPAEPACDGRSCAPARAASGTGATPTDSGNRFAAIPPGRKRLPANGEAFVNAVHRQVDLVQLEVTLLHHEDEKIVQRELAYLRELRYGKRAPETAEAPQVIFRSTGREGDLV